MSERWAMVRNSPAVVDGGLLLVLGLLATYGFHDTFTGWTYFIAAFAGLVLGIVLAELAVRLGQPLIVLAVLVVATFFLLGGAVALHGLGGTAVLPVPDTLQRLAESSVHGWKELLTTLPPVDGGPLLTLPYLLGLVTGACGMTLARRLSAPALPALAPLALLAAVILLGVQSPGGVLALAAAFAVVLVAWVVIRHRRVRGIVRVGGRPLTRRATAVALCLGASAAAVAVGPQLPGLADDRVVLRTYVEKPFDVGQYPSPLAGFRPYTKGYQGPESRKLYDQPLFEVHGLPEGTLVRIAALDRYDGRVWGAANDSGTEPGLEDTFLKVGRVIDNPATGAAVSASVTIADGYAGVWLPTAGSLTGIEIQRPSGTEAGDAFRYNLASSTGVYPPGIGPGDTYSFEAVLPKDELGPDTVPWSGGVQGAEAGSRFQQLATKWGGSAGSPMEQVLAVAHRLRDDGRYTDGEKGNEQFPAGHSLRRLTDFVAADAQIAGNDEQYAAMMALLANQLGVPARVVLGAATPADGVVHGRDVHAWVEIRAAEGSWRTLPYTEFMNTEIPPEDQSPQPQQRVAGNVVPPPAPVRPPSSVGDPYADGVNQKARTGGDEPGPIAGAAGVLLRYVAPPLLLVVLVLGSIVGSKAWRRRLRRTRGHPTRRLALAWRELLDTARDLGIAVPVLATRREQATALDGEGFAGLRVMANDTDVAMFGPVPPTADETAAYWARADELRRQMTRAHGRWTRLRAALNVTTLLPRGSTIR